MRWPKIWSIVVLLILNALPVSILVFVGYPGLKERPGPRPAFEAALLAAQHPESKDIHRGLVALRLDNPMLLWDQSPGAESARVLVATWTNKLECEEQGGVDCHLQREAWVTPVPQLQHFCRALGLTGQGLSDRLVQYLGLRPERGKAAVIELWVDKNNIFRPCADSEIDDQECRLGSPAVPPNGSAQAEKDAQWFQAQFFRSYHDKQQAMPWTRLGYTYDWGNPVSKVGASEYVIREKSQVWVHSSMSTDAYCDPKSLVPRTRGEQSSQPPGTMAKP
jgi:hypothetical protein